MIDYSGWSAQKLKSAGESVNADPLVKVGNLLAFGEAKAREIDADLREALDVLTGGWSGTAAAGAHARTLLTAQAAVARAGDAAAASTKAFDFARSMATAAAEVRAMPAVDPPVESPTIALVGPSGTAGAYATRAAEAARQRKALVAKITAMDSQAQNASAGLTGSFTAGRIDPQPVPPASLPPLPGGGTGTTGAGSTRTPSTTRRQAVTSAPTTKKDPKPGGTSKDAKPGSTPTASGPDGASTVPGSGGASTVPGSGGSSTVPAAAGVGTLPQSFTAPTAAGAVTSPAPGTQPGGTAVPGGASTAGGAGGVGGSLLGRSPTTGGASTTPGASGAGLPGTVSGGRAPGAAGTTGGGLSARPSTGPRPATSLGGARPGSTAPLGPMAPGAGPTGQAPRRTVGPGGALRGAVGEPSVGSRPGVLPGGPVGGVGGGGAGRGAPGRAGRALPMGAAGRRRDEDTELSARPDYLVETDNVWGDGRKVARGVIGRRPRNSEERDTW